MKIVPIAANIVKVVCDHFGWIDDGVEIEISDNADGMVHIVISKNSEWSVNKTFADLGDKNHIDVNLKLPPKPSYSLQEM